MWKPVVPIPREKFGAERNSPRTAGATVITIENLISPTMDFSPLISQSVAILAMVTPHF